MKKQNQIRHGSHLGKVFNFAGKKAQKIWNRNRKANFWFQPSGSHSGQNICQRWHFDKPDTRLSMCYRERAMSWKRKRNVKMRPVEALLITITVILLLYIQLNHAHCFVFRMMYERWATECLTVLTAAMMRARNRRQRRLLRAPYAWSVPRPVESWFDLHYYDPTIPQEFFRQQLRVTRNTFNQILNTLNHRLVRQQSRFRDPLPPEKILALGLYRLGHGNSYVSIGPSFNVGKATVIEAVQDVVEALYEIRNEHIKFPENEAETRAAIETFQDLSDLPNIVGAIDGSHVRIKAPKDSPVDYFSRYQQHDFIIQAVVNGQKLFLDFACGYPGSMHDARVLRRSSIFRRAEGGDILIAPTVNINGNEIGPYLVGDSAYPLSPWLMKPYPEGTRDRAEIKFNKELSSARVLQ